MYGEFLKINETALKHQNVFIPLNLLLLSFIFTREQREQQEHHRNEKKIENP